MVLFDNDPLTQDDNATCCIETLPSQYVLNKHRSRQSEGYTVDKKIELVWSLVGFGGCVEESMSLDTTATVRLPQFSINQSNRPTLEQSMLNVLVRPILAVAAATLGGILAGSTVASAAATSRNQQHNIEWAYPSPYDDSETNETNEANEEENEKNEKSEKNERFLPTESFRKKTTTWNLKKLLDTWTQEDDEETWPWIWTFHNKHGTHAVFIGVDNHTLDECQSFAEESPQHNLTIVASTDDIISQGLTLEDFYMHRCAIIDSSPKQIDMENQILMLEDERLICYDVLKFALKRAATSFSE
tara:strand:+ start:53 stop:958 length:906 start_codon:yes stop_codon:yes gene_type:complete